MRRRFLLPVEVCKQPTEWFDDFVNTDRGSQLTHVIAIERVGPSHDEQSLATQPRERAAAPLAEFVAKVPPEHRDRCHNARGKLIDDSTAPLHLIFEHGGGNGRA